MASPLRQQSSAPIRPSEVADATAAGQAILCPGCHQPNPARARFCQHCGRNLDLNSQGAGHYRIVRVIKSGGMGAVYEAVGEGGERYALKELLDRSSDEQQRAEHIKSFLDEASLLERLAHPCIPRVYSNFSDGGRYYLAMDFVEGEDLEQLLEREGAQPEARVLEWAGQLCDVLGYLHRNDLIYRDMKPSNIMLDRRSGGVKLVDFGITRTFQPSERGTLIGTPGYAPPEQYQGLTSPASDIYALGATLHHALTGRDPRPETPFSFPPLRSLKPQISRQTEAAIDQALALHSAERWGSMAEFKQALLRSAPRTQRPALPAAEVLARPDAAPKVVPGMAAALVPPPQQARKTSWLRRLVRRLVLFALALLVATAALSTTTPATSARYFPWLPAVERYIQSLPLLNNGSS